MNDHQHPSATNANTHPSCAPVAAEPLQVSDRVSVILDEIAQAAVAIEGLAHELCLNPDGQAARILPDAIIALSQRIGWAADLANGGIGLRGDASNWMMPPAYHRPQ